MIGSCLRWMIRTENPNERDVHLKAGLEYKLSQHCSSPMNTQHPKGSLWQEWIRSYFTDLQIPDAWGRLWQLWGSPQTYMALQITYQFTQLVKHSLKPQHFACQVAPYQTVSSNIFHTIYINFQLWRAVRCLGSYLSQLPRIFPSIFLSFPNTGHRPQGEKLPPIHCTMDTKGKGSRLLISPVKQKNIKKQMSFQSQTGNEWDLHQTTTMGKISSPIGSKSPTQNRHNDAYNIIQWLLIKGCVSFFVGSLPQKRWVAKDQLVTSLEPRTPQQRWSPDRAYVCFRCWLIQNSGLGNASKCTK